MLHLLATTVPAAAASGEVATIFAIAASAVVVLGGLIALVRAIWKVANLIRDNTQATQNLTTRMDALATSVDGRFDQLMHRVETLEHRIKEKA